MFNFKRRKNVLYLFDQWNLAHDAFAILPSEHEFNNIIHHYAGPNRHYHGVNHLVFGLSTIDRLCGLMKIGSKDRATLILAFFFHDMIYDVKRKDNEAQSAICAHEYLVAVGIEPDQIMNLITGTSDHQNTQSPDPLWDIMNDADLVIFSADDRNYRKYAKNVWKEYSIIATRKQFVAGRLQFIKNFNSGSIFKTRTMMLSEGTAKGNLVNEYLRLTGEADKLGVAY